MKKIVLSVLICCAVFVSAAQLAVKVEAKKISDQVFDLRFQFNGDKTGFIYGDNPSLEITGPVIELLNASATMTALSGKLMRVADPVFAPDKTWGYHSTQPLVVQILFKEKPVSVLRGKIKGFYREGDQFLSFELPFETILTGEAVDSVDRSQVFMTELSRPLHDCGEEIDEKNSSAWTVFLLGLAGGLLALFTPCVFPMIPVTVSFFTHKATTRRQGITNGLLYGGFIFLIYIAASLPFHLVKGLKPELLNNIATSAPLNLLFFVVFLFFALSFFGLFTISLPSSLATGASKQTGIFFMSLTLVIVSFSCTGPIIGSLLVGTMSGGAWLLSSGLAGFGVALGLPFGLFAVFPHWLKKLPRSGGWLEQFKVTLAFIELALAFKFLSNADLVMHWGILKREVFMAIWILIFIAMSIYLLDLGSWYRYGRLMIGKFRLGLAIFIFLFALYLVPALHPKGHPGLSFLSGFPPPETYSVYQKGSKGTHALQPIVNDLDLAFKKAKELNKPILIDFTGWACVNCRKMEEQVWVKPEIAAVIREKYILVSLYVDDKKLLPLEERTESIQTVGDKWAAFQATHFKQVTQPLYVAVSAEGKLLTRPVGYTPDAGKYLQWLECGVEE